MQEQYNMIFSVFRQKLLQISSVWILILTSMDSVIPTALIFVNDKKNFKTFTSMFLSPAAVSKSCVVPKIEIVQMLLAEEVTPVALDAKFQCVWNVIVLRLIAMGSTRCHQVLSSMT